MKWECVSCVQSNFTNCLKLKCVRAMVKLNCQRKLILKLSSHAFNLCWNSSIDSFSVKLNLTAKTKPKNE